MTINSEVCLKQPEGAGLFDWRFQALKASQCAALKLQQIFPHHKIVAHTKQCGRKFLGVLQVSGNCNCIAGGRWCPSSLEIAVDANGCPVFGIFSRPQAGPGNPVLVGGVCIVKQGEKLSQTVTRYLNDSGQVAMETIQ